MSTRFDLEAYDEQPFFYEDEDEEEVGRSRRSAIRGSSFAGRAGSRFGGKRKKRPRPRIKFPAFGRGGLSPIAVFPGLFVEPGKEPTGQKPGKDSAPSGMPSPPPESDSPSEGSEYIRWVQTSLNQILKLNLQTNGVMDADTRGAIRSFQQREKLPVTGVVGPDTQQALIAATRNQMGQAGHTNQPDQGDQPDQTDQEIPWLSSIFPALATAQIEDRTAFGLKENRKGKPRDMSKVYALVLHQTAFSRGNDTTKYDRIPVHFVITPNGKIIQLHPLAAYLWSSNGFNTGSVAVEFVGNFPNTKGKCWQAQKFGCHRLTQEQINAGRSLIRHLISTMKLTHVLAHRQSSGQRENDPGPDVWYHVGQWAIENLGLKDGGPGFRVGSGKPIPEEWRRWGQLQPNKATGEMPQTFYESPFSDESLLYQIGDGEEAFLGGLKKAVSGVAKAVSKAVPRPIHSLARTATRTVGHATRGIGNAAKAVNKFVPLSQITDAAARFAPVTPWGLATRAALGGLGAAAKGQNVWRGATRSLTPDVGTRFLIDTGMGVARGQNIWQAARRAGQAGISDVRERMRFAEMVAPFIPGIGTGIGAALGAANALANGRPITDALIAGARGALPGGALAQTAFDVGVNMLKGKSLAESALAAARERLPGGPAAKAAFDAAVALAQGKNLQQAAFKAAGRMLPPSPYAADALNFAQRIAKGENLQTAALSMAGKQVLGRMQQIATKR